MDTILDYLKVFKNIDSYEPPRPRSKVPGPRLMAKADIPRHLWDNFNTPDLEQSEFLRPGETLEDWDVTFRRPNAEGGVQQLVRNTADGSRPGYAGKKLESGKKGVTINGKQYRKITNPTHPKFGKISFPTSKAGKDITEYLTVEEVKNRVKGKKKIYTESLDAMAKKNVKISQKLNKDINSWASNWFKNNQSKYAVRDFDKFSKAFEKAWKKELAANPDKYKGFMSSAKTIKFTPEGLPAIKDGITINGIQFPQRPDASLAWKKLFYKSKLKDKNFNAKVNKYLDWNLTKKWAGGAGSMPKTAALDYGKLIKGIDDDVVFFMGEVLNNRALNPGGGQIGINDIFKKSIGKNADAYFKKYQGSWGRWVNNFYDVAKLAGLDQSQAKALLQKQINDTQKIMKVYNVKKLPLEFMVAQDHIMGLAEAKHLGDPKIAAQTLKNLVASTREQNRYLGQEGFSNRRVKLIKDLKAAPKNARGPIIKKLNALSEEFVPGRLKYDVRKDGSLKITNLQPETTLKAKKVSYEKITKTFPKNVQKLFTDSMQTNLSPRSVAQLSKEFGCGKKQGGGSIMSCLRKNFEKAPDKFLQRAAPLAKDNMNLYKWFQNGRKIARGTGVALLWEAALAPVIGAWSALEGKSGPRILNEIAYGIPFIGETEKEEWMRVAGGDQLAYKMKQLGEIENQELPYLYQQLEKTRAQNALTRAKMPNYVSPKERFILEDIKEKKLKLEALYNTPEFYEGPAASYGYNQKVIKDAYDLEQQTTAKIAADDAARKKQRWESYVPWSSQRQMAEGGIMSLKK